MAPSIGRGFQIRIYVTTDAHGAKGMQKAGRYAVGEQCDAIIVTGDVWHMPSMPLPTHVIRGNHEQEFAWKPNNKRVGKNIVRHEDYTTFELGGLKFGVLGRMDEEAHFDAIISGVWLGEPSNRSFVKDRILAQKLSGSDVLLLHDTPYPYAYDGSKLPGGSGWLRELVRQVSPRLVFHGHTHETYIRPLGASMVFGLSPCDPEFGVEELAVLDTDTQYVSVQRWQSFGDE